MALRELFAVFGFEFDEAALEKMDRKVTSLIAKIEELASELDDTTLAAKHLTPAMTQAGAATDAASRASDGLADNLRETAEASDQVARRMGRSGSGLSHWAAQAKAAGVSVVGLRGAVTGLQSRVAQARDGDRQLSSAFRALKIDLDKVSSSGRSSASVWQEVVGRLSGVESGAKRSRLALALLGQEGAKIAAADLARTPRTARIQRRLAAVAAPEAPEGAPAAPGTQGLRSDLAAIAPQVARVTRLTAAGSAALRRWRDQAQAAGVSAAGLRGAMTGLQARVAAAATGDRELAKSFQALGMSVDKVSRSGRSYSSVWQEVVGRLSKVEDQAQRSRLALTLLGQEGAKAAAAALARGPRGERVQRRLDAPVAQRRPVGQGPSARAVSAWQRFRGLLQRTGPVLGRVEVFASRTDRSIRRMGAGADRASGGLQRMGGAAQRASSSGVGQILKANFWTMLAGGITRATSALVRFSARGIASFAGLIAETALWTDATEKALGMISGFGLQTGIREFEDATRTAADLALSVTDAGNAYKKLRGVGFDRQKALDLVKLSADMKAGLGLTDETVGRVQLAISQIKGAGKLQGDELRQLQETGLSVDRIWQSISEQMGVTVQEAMKLKEQGKVGADVALEAIQSAVLTTLGTTAPGEAAKKLASETLRGVVGQAKGAAQLWVIELGKAVTPGLDHLAKRMGTSFGRMSDSGTIERFTRSVERFITDLVDVIDIHWPRIEKLLDGLINVSAEGIDSATMSIDGFVDAILSAAEWVQRNWPLIKAYIQAGIEINWKPIFAALGILIKVLAKAVDLTSSLHSLLADFKGLIESKFDSPWVSIIAGVANAATAAMGPLQGMIKMLKLALQLLGTYDAAPKPQAGKAVAAGRSRVAAAVARLEQSEGRKKEGGARAEVNDLLSNLGAGPSLAPAVVPASGGTTQRTIQLTDRRTLNVGVSAPNPVEAAKRVDRTIRKTSSDDQGALLAALAGATDG